MTVVYFLLLLTAVVCFALAAFGVVVRRIELTALGLLAFALVPFLKVTLNL